MIASSFPSTGTASLPMYDFPELRSHHDALWSAFREQLAGTGLRAAPDSLTHADDVHALWHSPSLFLSQSCGWPVVDELLDRVHIVGAFSYSVPSAMGATYRSRIVVRDGTATIDPSSATAAVNSFRSLSGWVSLVRAFSDLDGVWPGRTVETGAHVASLAALGDGIVDVAAIDGVTLELMRRHRPQLLDGLTVLHDGPQIPCLPIVVGREATTVEIDAIRDAFVAAVEHLTPEHREGLLVTGFHPCGFEAYAPVAAMAVRLAGTGAQPSP